VLADVKAGGGFDLATLSVAVREIQNLIDATRYQLGLDRATYSV